MSTGLDSIVYCDIKLSKQILGLDDIFEFSALLGCEESMRNKNKFLAIDIGASSGRLIQGKFNGENLEIAKAFEFPNNFILSNGILTWDIAYILQRIQIGLKLYAAKNQNLSSIGIDTCGVDFGLLDKDGELIKAPFCYRDHQFCDIMQKVHGIVSGEKLFKITGMNHRRYNTIYQLFSMVQKNDPALFKTKTFLMIPDLLGYFLTGEISSEFTNAATTQLLNIEEMGWAEELINLIGVRKSIFPDISMPATHKGVLLPEVSAETGLGSIPLINVASHDTASALAMPLICDKDTAYLSSGTWSIMGFNTGKPIISKTVLEKGFTNEATIKGDFRIAKDIIGLWIMQECKRYWAKIGITIDWESITELAANSERIGSVIDPNDQLFFEPGNMPHKIQQYCKQTKQKIPQSIGELARVVFESLALCYRWVFEDLEELKGSSINVLHIIGGGSQNRLLNQFTSNAVKRPVYAGPIEATAIGNIVAQMYALGEINNYHDVDCILQKSFDIMLYEPKDQDFWDEQYAKYLKIIQSL